MKSGHGSFVFGIKGGAAGTGATRRNEHGEDPPFERGWEGDIGSAHLKALGRRAPLPCFLVNLEGKIITLAYASVA